MTGRSQEILSIINLQIHTTYTIQLFLFSEEKYEQGGLNYHYFIYWDRIMFSRQTLTV